MIQFNPVPIPPSSDAMNNEESDTEDNDSDAGVIEYTYVYTT